MASINSAVRRVKDDPCHWISEALVREACAAEDYQFRERALPPWVTIQLFVLQVLWGNVACRAVMHLTDVVCSAQAYCAARMRLPIDVLGAVAAMLTHDARQATRDFGRWKGHRVMHIDGTGLSMPDTQALRDAFGQPTGQTLGCGPRKFPVMHVLWLFDAANFRGRA